MHLPYNRSLLRWHNLPTMLPAQLLRPSLAKMQELPREAAVRPDQLPLLVLSSLATIAECLPMRPLPLEHVLQLIDP